MCGIAGILTREPLADGVRRVTAMRHALRHRGPDDGGTWESPSRQAVFGHTRLAIIDLTRAGHQPMCSPDGRLTIVFNGEIYNFKELGCELAQHGVALRSQTDTEVILAAYQVFGEACVDRLRGMFAFAIWDERERTCFVARDRFGIKPFYYSATADRLIFASELRAVLTCGLVPRDLDAEGMFGYFRSGSVPEPQTLLRAVKVLEAGHVGRWHDGQFHSRRYWDFTFGSGDAGPSAEAVTSALVDSVRHHFVSDVPVGVFLSGGIDSTAIVAIASHAGVKDLRTITLSVPGSPDDEAARARQTAEHFGTNHAECRVDAATGKQLFSQYLRAVDQPSIEGLNTFAVCGLAHELGMKVMLSGVGADELFGGYPSFRAVPRLAAIRRTLAGAGPLNRAAAAVFGAASDPRHRRLADIFLQPPSLSASYVAFRGIFSRAESQTLVERYAGISLPALEDAVVGATDPTAEDGVSRLELSRYVRHQLLRESDVMSMSFGLELRTPYLDAGLVDAVTAAPARFRLAPGKQFLLRSVPGMPDGVAYRSKRVFQFPFDQWIDGEWHEVFAGLDQSCPVPTGAWYRKWCVFVLGRWLQTLDSEG